MGEAIFPGGQLSAGGRRGNFPGAVFVGGGGGVRNFPGVPFFQRPVFLISWWLHKRFPFR